MSYVLLSDINVILFATLKIHICNEIMLCVTGEQDIAVIVTVTVRRRCTRKTTSTRPTNCLASGLLLICC